MSSTGIAYAVVFFPENVPTTDVGAGGGPGIGVREAVNGAPFYLSADGANWAPFDSGFELAVEVETALFRAQPRLLSEMDPVNPSSPVIGEDVAPVRTVFHKPFPNPFNPRVELSFALAEAGSVRLEVYDVRGPHVRTLAEGPHAIGSHEIVWEGDDEAGRPVASGVYFARFTGPSATVTHRMALIR